MPAETGDRRNIATPLGSAELEHKLELKKHTHANPDRVRRHEGFGAGADRGTFPLAHGTPAPSARRERGARSEAARPGRKE